LNFIIPIIIFSYFVMISFNTTKVLIIYGYLADQLNIYHLILFDSNYYTKILTIFFYKD